MNHFVIIRNTAGCGQLVQTRIREHTRYGGSIAGIPRISMHYQCDFCDRRFGQLERTVPVTDIAAYSRQMVFPRRCVRPVDVQIPGLHTEARRRLGLTGNRRSLALRTTRRSRSGRQLKRAGWFSALLGSAAVEEAIIKVCCQSAIGVGCAGTGIGH
jgi:hypothetical protein